MSINKFILINILILTKSLYPNCDECKNLRNNNPYNSIKIILSNNEINKLIDIFGNKFYSYTLEEIEKFRSEESFYEPFKISLENKIIFLEFPIEIEKNLCNILCERSEEVKRLNAKDRHALIALSKFELLKNLIGNYYQNPETQIFLTFEHKKTFFEQGLIYAGGISLILASLILYKHLIHNPIMEASIKRAVSKLEKKIDTLQKNISSRVQKAYERGYIKGFKSNLIKKKLESK
ncbi:hypothetical protein KAW80_04095 [Candidatus Babeliales bacterium]|nr:hypothetical protein [Candidatus Babeliales bacterium]